MANLKIILSETIELNDSIETKSFIGNSKKFISHQISGWFPSKRNDLSPEGVNKLRVIDRFNNKYIEKIVDIKTGRVIRHIEEKLKDHK